MDIVFISARVAVFVDGCFRHWCPEHGTTPKANWAWWQPTLTANPARDADTDRRFGEAGWKVVHVWEHEELLLPPPGSPNSSALGQADLASKAVG